MRHPSPASRLPLAVDSFVALESEMAEVIALVRSSRLVTLTGPAGVGKTRLALEIAARLAPAHGDGAVFVALDRVTDPALVPQAVAGALSLAEQPDRPLSDTLVDALRQSGRLVVLDNCEHLIGAVAELTDRLLRACDGVSFLATSQEPLAIAGERPWVLAPLGLPDVDLAVPEAVADFPAVRLFVERAVAILPGFALTPEVAPAVVEICRRLDGVPLAIELAAARVTVLPPAEIAARLDDRFTLLSRGSRAARPRHQSLRAALDWSHALCSPPERAMLRRLSVFAGGGSLGAIEEVCTGREVPPEAVFDLLAGLVARSLVVAEIAGPEARYRLLETVRHYARDRLFEAGESAATRGRHAGWCATLAECAEPGLTGADQHGWLASLEAEHDNLRAALDWAIADAQAEPALRLAGALVLFWRVRGHFSEGRRYLDAALALAEGAPLHLRAKLRWGSGFLALMLGDTGTAIVHLDEAVNLYREDGDVRGQARSLLLVGNCRVFTAPRTAQPVLEQSVALAREAADDWCLAHGLALCALAHLNQSEPAVARALLEESVAVARRGTDKQGLRIGLALVGQLAFVQGDHVAAEAALTETLGITRELGEAYGTAVALIGLGELWTQRGDYSRARELLDEAETLAQVVDTRTAVLDALGAQARLSQAQGDLATAGGLFRSVLSMVADAGGTCCAGLRGLGEVVAAQGDSGRARQLLEEALRLARDSGDGREQAATLHQLAEVARSDGDHERATSLHQEALGLRRQIGDDPGMVESLEALGGLAAHSGGRARAHAARLLAAAQAARDQRRYARRPTRLPRWEEDVASLRDGLRPEELEAAWAQGAAMSINDAVSYATRGRGTRGRPATGWAALTRAERAVAALAAEGLTNAEIGERLFITAQTVKGHLAHIFAKLGVTSRVELAREAAVAGLGAQAAAPEGGGEAPRRRSHR